ncbi:hypothetical protein HDU93_007917 [Gonapodya sp. JEL0774]|nr:hypothetical protein HDU93_007917 [Gonapodya sp. JEL0774]
MASTLTVTSSLHSTAPLSAAQRKPTKGALSRGATRTAGPKTHRKSAKTKDHAAPDSKAGAIGAQTVDVAAKDPAGEHAVPDTERIEWADDLSWDVDFAKVDDLLNRRDSTASSYTEACRLLGVNPVRHIAENWSERELGLSNMTLGGPQGTEALAIAMATNKTISNLNLANNSLGENAVSLFQQLASNRTLTHLNLSGNRFGGTPRYLPSPETSPGAVAHILQLSPAYLPHPSAAMQALAEYMGYTSTLRVLILRNSALGDLDALTLAQGIRGNSSLEVLDLTQNEVGDVGVLALADGIKATAIKKLYLGAQLATVQLTHLDVSRNGIADTGAIALGSWVTRNPALVLLDVSEGRIGDTGAAALGKAAGDGKLEELYIGRNPFNDQGALPILKAASLNIALKVLSIPGIRLSHDARTKLDDLRRERESLRVIPSNPFTRLGVRVRDAYYYYRVETGIYMLDAWEAAIFSTFSFNKAGRTCLVRVARLYSLVLVVLTLAIYAGVTYSPAWMERSQHFLLYLGGGEQTPWAVPVRIALDEKHAIPST